MNAPSPHPKLKAADLLLRAGALTRERYDVVARLVARGEERSEEVLVESGHFTESDLLKALSSVYRTQFVGTERLSRADVPRATVQMIPRRVAETYGVFPVLFDAQKSLLSVVTADPDAHDMLREIQLVSGASEVKAFVARPAAVRAAILKHHAGDAGAFARLEHATHTAAVAGRGEASRVSKAPTPDRSGAPPLVLEIPTDLEIPKIAPNPVPRVLAPEPPKPAPAPPADPAVQLRDAARGVFPADPTPLSTAALMPFSPPRRSLTPGGSSPPRASLVPGGLLGGGHARVFTDESSLELLTVLVSLLESSRADLRGHSSNVARLVRRLAERLKLTHAQTAEMVIAAFVHDLGKAGAFHLTALNVAEYDGHRIGAKKTFEAPIRILESVGLPSGVEKAVFHMYERVDGTGFPEGLVGKEIPLGARVLALADTYADLTQNPKNPLRRILQPAEAMAVLEQRRDTVFDAGLVDLFKSVMLGDDVRARLLANRYTVLVVDPDPEETTLLELRLVEQGFDVKTARSLKEAREALPTVEGLDLVLFELELPDGDGLEWLREGKATAQGKDIPWVVHTRRQGRADAQKAFQLGAADYVAKPTQGDVLVAKLKAMLDSLATGRGSRGVSGSLSEMGLPDIVQILFHGRKTGRLSVRSGGELGEIHFQEGQVVHAISGKQRGAEAFYALLRYREGEFGLDPTFVPPVRVIETSAEGLLLEGMRRLDEGL